jgi:hypothetical protein
LPVNVASEVPAQPVETGDIGATPAPRGGLPRKGMTLSEVEGLLGSAVESSERPEGSLRVITRTYRSGDGRVTAEFVEDVLFRYSVRSD